MGAITFTLGGSTLSKKRRASAPKWQYVGLGALAVATAAVVGFAVMEPNKAQPPVPDSVATYKAPAPTQQPVLKVAVIGDSYSQGTGAGSPAMGWVSRLAQNQTWNVTNLAKGGTGYFTSVTANAKAACGDDYCPSYAEVIDKAKAASPSLVLVAGGRNDAKVDPASESAAVEDFYKSLRAAVPDAKIVAFNPLWDDEAAPAALGAIAQDVRSSVESVGGVYLDASQPLASHPELIAPDGIHPNPAGHAAIFEANLKALQSAGLAAR